MAAKKLGISKIFVWVLLGLLFVGLAGFGATNLSGTINNIGRVGDKSISVERYANTIQQEIRAFEAQTGQSITFQQAEAFGITDRALAQLVTSAALDHEAAQMGLSIGDDELVGQLREIQAFQGPDGQFDRDAYRFALQNVGLSEAEFEEDLRSESARTLLQGAVLAGNAVPETYVNTLVSYALEQRDISWVALNREDLATEILDPTEAQLKTFYDENLDQYTRPESRDITYAWITPTMILDTVEVDEDLLRKAYDDRHDEFNLPERRLVERLVFGSEQDAQAAADRITAGESDFEAEVQARGLALSDTDMGDVTVDDLDTAADAVFAVETGDIAGPTETDLGPALFRVNAVLPAQTTSFEEARATLRAGLALDRARRVIETMAEDAEDLLAGGATVEELAKETEFELGTIAFEQQSEDIIAGYPAFRELATTVTEDDFPTVGHLGDGGLFALRLNGVTPPAPIPLDEVRAKVTEDWLQAQEVEALVAQAEAAAEQVTQSGDFAAAGLAEPTAQTGLTRGSRVDGAPAEAMTAAFEMAPGDVRALPTPTGAVVMRLDAVNAVDVDSEDARTLANRFNQEASGAIAQDIFNALATDIQMRAGISIDQQARAAVHANFQ